MKTKIEKSVKMMAVLIIISCMTAEAQTTKKTAGVLNIYSSGIGIEDTQMGNLVRSEVEKLDTFDVIDRFDIDYMIKQKSLNAECNSKLCLVEIGKIINADKMFSGSVEMIGQKIIITLRLIDVKTGAVEKTCVNEFLNLPSEIKSMLNISVCEMFGVKTDEALKSKLSEKFAYDNAINNPTVDRLNCSGTRMGATFFTGRNASLIRKPKQEGGYDAYPVMFQFGYQFEKQYLNEGNFQALFEFIPVATGLDQGYFIPSLSIMNGLRSNKNGWEFAFGPTLLATKMAEGYVENGAWHISTEWTNDTVPNPYPYVARMDSRGGLRITSEFVFAFGKTIKSGNLNIPINIYVIPHKDGMRFGLSFGYNSKKKKNS